MSSVHNSDIYVYTINSSNLLLFTFHHTDTACKTNLTRQLTKDINWSHDELHLYFLQNKERKSYILWSSKTISWLLVVLASVCKTVYNLWREKWGLTHLLVWYAWKTDIVHNNDTFTRLVKSLFVNLMLNLLRIFLII